MRKKQQTNEINKPKLKILLPWKYKPLITQAPGRIQNVDPLIWEPHY